MTIDLTKAYESGWIVRVGQKNKQLYMFPEFSENVYESINYGSFTPRQPAIKKLLRQTVEKYNIQDDFEFYVWIFDSVPDFSLAKNHYSYQYTNDLYSNRGFPDFMFVNQPENGLFDYTETIESFVDTKPETKKIGWIGGNTSYRRGILFEETKKYNDILDFIEIKWSGRSVDMYKKTEGYMTYQDKINKWKYLLDVEGGGWSCRLKVLLNSPRIVFLIERQYKEYWFKHLEPWKHYIPVEYNLSDLVENYSRIEKDIELQYYIKNNIRQFCRENLTLDSAHVRVKEIIQECVIKKINN